MPVPGKCRLCNKDKDLLESHFVSRKLYFSGKKKLEFANLFETGFDPAELKAYLMCRECEHLLSAGGEEEVLKHVAPKYVLKNLPLHDRMRVACPRDNDPSAPRFDARDFHINTQKFAYFALSIVWRRAIHEWTSVLPRWELGQFAEDMRRFLLGEVPFPDYAAVIVIVCSDTVSRRTWTVPSAGGNYPWLDFSFQVRGIYFRVMMGHIPQWAYAASCVAPWCPIFYADCERRTKEVWDNLILTQEANRER
jgi:hypothetical protein